jgi:hypothetical protein
LPDAALPDVSSGQRAEKRIDGKEKGMIEFFRTRTPELKTDREE